MTLLDDLAVAKFPKKGCTYRLRLTGQPTVSHTKAGSKVTIPNVIFYDDKLPPSVLASRPVTIWLEAIGDLEPVLEHYGTPDYDQLYVVKVVPRYPGAVAAIMLEVQVLESHNLLRYFRDAPSSTPPAGAVEPPAAAALAPTAAPPAAAATPPTCRQCGQPATRFDNRWVHCGREVGS